MHDDVIKWKHFPRYWSFVRGIHRSRWIPHTRNFDVFFDLRLNKWGWWFETPSWSLWRQCNVSSLSCTVNIMIFWFQYHESQITVVKTIILSLIITTVSININATNTIPMVTMRIESQEFKPQSGKHNSNTIDSQYIAVPYNTKPHTVH